MKISYRKGFTLIELLVVIAIIGILSSIVLASLNTAREKSRDARRQTDLQQIALAFELFFDTCGEYPENTVNGTSEIPVGTLSAGTCTSDLSDFMTTIPTDPTPTQDYMYERVSATNYCLGADYEGSNLPSNHNATCATTVGTTYAITP